MPYAQWHYPFENKDIFEKHYPADYICEAIDQTRGWFYTLHAIAALADDSVAYKNCVCLSHIVDETGKKMSKSQGNIVNPYDVFRHHRCRCFALVIPGAVSAGRTKKDFSQYCSRSRRVLREYTLEYL